MLNNDDESKTVTSCIVPYPIWHPQKRKMINQSNAWNRLLWESHLHYTIFSAYKRMSWTFYMYILPIPSKFACLRPRRCCAQYAANIPFKFKNRKITEFPVEYETYIHVWRYSQFSILWLKNDFCKENENS